MKGKRIGAFVMAALMVLSLGACSGKGKDQSLQQVLNKKAYIIGFDAQYMPMGYTDANGTYVGFDLDIAKELSKRLDVTLNLQPVSVDNAVSELTDKTVDYLGNNLSLAGDYKGKTAYSKTILKNRQVVVVSKDSAYQGKGDLADKKVGVVSGSRSAVALDGDKTFHSKVQTVDMKDRSVAFEALNKKEVEAVIMDEVFARYQMKNGANIRMLDGELAMEDYRMVFRKKDKALIKKINELLADMAKDGTLAKISEKWFGENILEIK